MSHEHIWRKNNHEVPEVEETQAKAREVWGQRSSGGGELRGFTHLTLRWGFIHQSVPGSQETPLPFFLQFPVWSLCERSSGWKLGRCQTSYMPGSSFCRLGLCSLITKLCSRVLSCIFWNPILFTSGAFSAPCPAPFTTPWPPFWSFCP